MPSHIQQQLCTPNKTTSLLLLLIPPLPFLVLSYTLTFLVPNPFFFFLFFVFPDRFSPSVPISPASAAQLFHPFSGSAPRADISISRFATYVNNISERAFASKGRNPLALLNPFYRQESVASIRLFWFLITFVFPSRVSSLVLTPSNPSFILQWAQWSHLEFL